MGTVGTLGPPGTRQAPPRAQQEPRWPRPCSFTISRPGECEGKYLPRPLVFAQGELLARSQSSWTQPPPTAPRGGSTGHGAMGRPPVPQTALALCTSRQLPASHLELQFRSCWCGLRVLVTGIISSTPHQFSSAPTLLPTHGRGCRDSRRPESLAGTEQSRRRGGLGRQRGP